MTLACSTACFAGEAGPGTSETHPERPRITVFTVPAARIVLPDTFEGLAVRSPTANRRRTLAQRDARLGLASSRRRSLSWSPLSSSRCRGPFLISFQHLKLIEIGVANPLAPLTLDNFTRVISSGVPWSSSVRPLPIPSDR